MRISIIIPAYNEEKYLKKLLASIRRQTFTDYEVIVADANSQDKTKAIARQFGARVVKGGLPAVGRNNGARVARGEFLFFFDADVILPKTFLEAAYDEMQKYYLDLATGESFPLSNLKIDKIIFQLANISLKLAQFSNPHAPGYCMLVTRRLFERAGGFDESLKLAEDHDFAKRASVFRPLRVLESAYVKVSVRRLEKEGRMTLLKKYLTVEMHRMLKGEVYDEIVTYEFGTFNGAANTNDKLRQLENHLTKMAADFKKIVSRYVPSKARTKKFKLEIKKFRKRFASFQRKARTFIASAKIN